MDTNHFEVSLISNQTGEISQFLNRFTNQIECAHVGRTENASSSAGAAKTNPQDIKKCTYVYSNPLDSLNLITAVVENDNHIRIRVAYGKDCTYEVTHHNLNDFIVSLYGLFA